MVNPNIPEFPVCVFPECIQMIIEDFHEEMNYPVAFLGASILSAVSTCIGNSRKIKPKPDWIENCSMYVGLVGSPGAVKSPTLRAIFKPLKTRDHESILQYNKAIAEYNATPTESRGPRPLSKQRIVSDTTIEALAELLSVNKLGLTMYNDELDQWISSFDRYHNKRGSEVNHWLSLNSGESIVINRKGQEQVISVKDPFVNVIGSIQPGILTRAFSGSNRDNGLLSRFLFSMNPYEHDAVLWGSGDLPQCVADRWDSFVQKLTGVSTDYLATGESAVYSLDNEGDEYIRLWHDSMETGINNLHNWIRQEIFRKLQTYVFRFALILHTMNEVANGVRDESLCVSIEEAKAACLLTHYFYMVNYEIYRMMDKSSSIDPEEKEEEKWNKYLSILDDVFTTKDAMRAALQLSIPERTMFNYLRNSQKVVNIDYGKYKKIK